jgi:hypothetical protein
MSPNNSQGLRRRNLNYGNYVLDLPTRTRMCVRSQLYDRGREVRSYTPFFRPGGTLLTDGFTREKTESIPVKEITQLIKQLIPIGKREK